MTQRQVQAREDEINARVIEMLRQSIEEAEGLREEARSFAFKAMLNDRIYAALAEIEKVRSKSHKQAPAGA